MAKFTTDQLQKLKNMYATGVLETREGDTWVKFNTMRELRTAINEIEAEINNSKPSGTRLITINRNYKR